MPKKQEQPKPLFPLKHDFAKSLDNYIHQAGMLSDAVRTLIQMDQILHFALAYTSVLEHIHTFRSIQKMKCSFDLADREFASSRQPFDILCSKRSMA